jgi:hypothetical protein
VSVNINFEFSLIAYQSKGHAHVGLAVQHKANMGSLPLHQESALGAFARYRTAATKFKIIVNARRKEISSQSHPACQHRTSRASLFARMWYHFAVYPLTPDQKLRLVAFKQ